ncbi:hypothetical protein [Sphingopyxis macrogoltabida]|uniref:hypothetical protein n=1 Tax=Sphingopyxis macrogoltabida TaxID=33050 RepID=UPI0011EA6420|nr:hypothetical protein [Sphingopyxis macrogoltabida]
MSRIDLLTAMKALGLSGAMALEDNLQAIEDLVEFHYDDAERLNSVRSEFEKFHHPWARSIVERIDGHLTHISQVRR